MRRTARRVLLLAGCMAAVTLAIRWWRGQVGYVPRHAGDMGEGHLASPPLENVLDELRGYPTVERLIELRHTPEWLGEGLIEGPEEVSTTVEVPQVATPARPAQLIEEVLALPPASSPLAEQSLTPSAQPPTAPQPTAPALAAQIYQPRHSRVEGSRAVIAIAADVILAFLLTTVLWLTLFAFIPTLFGWEARVVVSGSMEPKVRVGDVVVVQPGIRDLTAGDLATFRDPAIQGRVLTHRLVRQDDNRQWITKGDANRSEDSTPVPESAIIGQPKVIVPMIGMPTYWRTTGEYPRAKLAVAAVMIVGLIVLRTLRRSAAGEQKNRVLSVAVPRQRDQSPVQLEKTGEQSQQPTTNEENSWESVSVSRSSPSD